MDQQNDEESKEKSKGGRRPTHSMTSSKRRKKGKKKKEVILRTATINLNLMTKAAKRLILLKRLKKVMKQKILGERKERKPKITKISKSLLLNPERERKKLSDIEENISSNKEVLKVDDDDEVNNARDEDVDDVSALEGDSKPKEEPPISLNVSSTPGEDKSDDKDDKSDDKEDKSKEDKSKSKEDKSDEKSDEEKIKDGDDKSVDVDEKSDEEKNKRRSKIRRRTQRR